MDNPRRWRDPITISTLVIAIAAVLNLAATAYIGTATRDYVAATNAYVRISQDSFHSSTRPYVGVTFVGLNSPCDRPPMPQELDAIRKSKNLPFMIEVQNFGTIPAREVSVGYVIKINGEVQRTTTETGGVVSLFPGQRFAVNNVALSNLIPLVLDGNATLEIEIEVKYRGYSDEQFVTKEHAKYESAGSSFSRMGAEYK